MKITYKLNKDIVARTAANLVFNLSEIKSIHIAKGNTCFNGKSLVGILSNNLLSGDIIKNRRIGIFLANQFSYMKKVFSYNYRSYRSPIFCKESRRERIALSGVMQRFFS